VTAWSKLETPCFGRVGGGGPADEKLVANESPKPVGDVTFWPVNLAGMPKASPVVDIPNASLEPVRFAASLGASFGGGAGAPNESPKPPGDGVGWFLDMPNASTLLCLVLDWGEGAAPLPSKAEPCNLARTGLGGFVPLTVRRESDTECCNLAP
jgi:hypothetical protein